MITIPNETYENIREYIEKNFTLTPQEEGGDIELYTKTVPVYAKPVSAGTQQDTIMADGFKETSNSAKSDGDMLVTNPAGEQYIVSAKEFNDKYELVPNSDENVNGQKFRPKSNPQKFVILPTNLGGIEFMAPWGEKMTLGPGSAVNVTNLENIYGIQASAFSTTYSRCDKDGNLIQSASPKRLGFGQPKDEKIRG